MVHIKCRNDFYPFTKITRLPIQDYQVPWSFIFEGYKPPEYNSEHLINKPWADPAIGSPNFQPKWNSINGKINRKSHMGQYMIKNEYPLNPEGRTGLAGRGILGKWGPNHAADPIVTRWKRNNGQQKFHSISKLPILEVCVIQRRDCNEWALPGGMVDPGENISITLKREFMEEALNSLERSGQQKSNDETMINSFFANGVAIYNGYVDDPRNTDNAWMETVAMNFHDDSGTAVGKFALQAGDDAKNVKWLEMSQDVLLYASHMSLIEKVVALRNAHW